MAFATTIYAFVCSVMVHIGILKPIPNIQTTDEVSAPETIQQRSRTESMKSDGSDVDSDAESDGSDGSPRLRGRADTRATAGPSTKKTDKKKGKPTCDKFNSKKGCNVQNCMMDHVCSVCFRNHSAVNCDAKK
ncbi:uncharacterized protein SCHCODRAFT_02516760 [Schizophyllum commune H4-8]|uniref:Uncharacterized protein n=1 Tax=Schizophyllum commune (strain H4-8 / FGSC 9210) TaxID=578458 RepID=D8QHA6_SCHCM|nr:uncharacterized protein SCHCODRAFT_02516760 [Schizophyllum commune H4-8]KAI5887095.1 hypothetical protein SCHCODRAFT_02516760 [Schizophyllum commune H4-8]